MNLEKTIVDEDRLEGWCRALPECRTFMENFFCSCAPYSWETNYLNYESDIATQQRIDPAWKSYEMPLMRAFMDITRQQTEFN